MTIEVTPEKSSEQFTIQRIYLKDVSFEAPNTPAIFRTQWQPTINIQLSAKNGYLEDNLYEVVLAITLTVNNGEKVSYLLELQQAGLFFIHGIEGGHLARVLGAFCPTILFPYAREAISDLVGKGGFPQLLLAPVNFDALFDEAIQKQQANLAQ